MFGTRPLAAALLAGLLVMACGDDDDTAGTTTTGEATTTSGVTTSQGASTTTGVTSTGVEGSSTTDAGAGTTTAPALEQPAIWPAADVVFTTPEEAAEDFVSQVLGVAPELGEFQQGDARSGEIEVLAPGEGDEPTDIVRSVLLLRQLGPQDGWFVLAAVNDNAAITAPEAMAEVAAAPLPVDGTARGFEGNVAVTAFVAGDATTQLDQVITMGGAMETPEPFNVTLDLSGASQGEVVALLVRGGTGLETDPGDFGAIPVVISG